MKDDDFSNIVRSGTAHSVNVSEYTGNAKNPKNMVREGDANELAQKKRTPEEVDAALYLEKLQSSKDTGHIEKVTPAAGGANTTVPQKPVAGGPAAANLQKAASGASTANVQPVNPDTAAKPNVQKVSGGSVADTRASIEADTAREPNRQGVGIDRLHDETATTAKEAFNDRMAHGGQTHLADNHQPLPGSTAATDNRQGLDTEHLRDNHATLAQDPIRENTQSIQQEHLADHRQALPGSPSGSDNHQGVDTEHLRDNHAALAKEPVSDNTQNLEQDNLADNHQPLPEGDAVQANRQGVDGEHQQDRQTGVTKDHLHDHTVSLDAGPAHEQPRHTEPAGPDDSHTLVSEGLATSHFHTISDDATADHRDELPASAHAQHDAPALSEHLSDNQQTLPDQAIANNLQTVAAPAATDNTQGVPKESFKDNTQAAPEAAPLSAQVPGVEKNAIEDHHEPLPDGNAPRHNADIATQEVHAGQAAPAGTVVARAPGPRAASSTKKAAPVVQAAASRRVVSSKAMDEFHGRLAGIKQTVDQLNHRLSDFEAQMEKDGDLPRGLDRD